MAQDTPRTLSAKDHFFRGSILGFSLFFVLNYFLPHPAFSYIGCALLLVIFQQGILRLSRTTLLVVCGLLAAGAGILLWKGVGLDGWVSALMQNANLAVLFVFAPMMSRPFFYEDYTGEIKRVVRSRMQSVVAFCLLTACCSHIMSVLISVGAVLLVYDLLSPYSALYEADDLFCSTIIRGQCSAGFWSPAWASMVAVTANVQVSWASLVPVGIGFSALFLCLHVASVAIRVKCHPGRYPRLQPDSGEKPDSGRIKALLIRVLALVGAIVFLNFATDWDLTIIIALMAVVFPLLCAALQRKMPAYRRGISKYYTESLVKAKSEIILFAAAGFLGKALQISGIGGLIPTLLPPWLTSYTFLMCAAVMLVMILPSFVGIHPIATGTALVTSLMPSALGMNAMTFAMTVLTGWALAVMLSPFSGIVLILSGATKKTPFWISLGLNGLFGAVCLVFFSALISAIGPLL